MQMFLRWEHGNHPVMMDQGKLTVSFPSNPKIYDTWSPLREELGTSLSFRAYFRLDQPKSETPSFILDYEKELRKPRPGIDVSKKAKDIKNLVIAGFGRKIFAGKYDVNDVLQEVFKGILVRNKGKCPWDGAKSSFGHYVHMVAGCEIHNFHRKQQKLPAVIDHSDLEVDIGQFGISEIEDVTPVDDSITSHDLCDFVVSKHPKDTDLIRSVFPHVIAGCSANEISGRIHETPSRVSKAVKAIRSSSAEWARQNDLNHMVPESYKKV